MLGRIAAGDRIGAEVGLDELRFKPIPRLPERWPPVSVIARIFARDKYECRYCGAKVILTPVMRLISRVFPDAFPYHHNWKADATHPAFITRSATLDHVEPIALGGDPVAEANLATACRGCNRRKGDLRVEELGWTVWDATDPAWRGLTELFEPAWISAGRPLLSEDEMSWMRATRVAAPDTKR